jgi:gas vesicle protein
MTQTRSFSGVHLLTAFITGAAAGAAVAFITAPRSGKETREALQVWARDVRGKAVRIPHAVGQAVERAARVGKEAFSESFGGNSARSDG